jgi:hypothetical protein
VLQWLWRDIARSIQRFVNPLHHALKIVRDVVIPEPQYAIAFFFKPSGPFLIPRNARQVAMLRAIDFNQQLAG